MKRRIENHRAERPSEWRTLEAPLNVGAAIDEELGKQPADLVLLDCMTLLANNVILELPENASEQEAEAALKLEVDSLLDSIKRSEANWIIVSNEVGLGLVPPYPLGRIYRDALGRANQQLAKHSNRVIMMVAGIPAIITSK
jgi:adenosylcobinamide kinase/adenosylcobinamide-phosphate guanylyltransferase